MVPILKVSQTTNLRSWGPSSQVWSIRSWNPSRLMGKIQKSGPTQSLNGDQIRSPDWWLIQTLSTHLGNKISHRQIRTEVRTKIVMVKSKKTEKEVAAVKIKSQKLRTRSNCLRSRSGRRTGRSRTATWSRVRRGQSSTSWITLDSPDSKTYAKHTMIPDMLHIETSYALQNMQWHLNAIRNSIYQSFVRRIMVMKGYRHYDIRTITLTINIYIHMSEYFKMSWEGTPKYCLKVQQLLLS